jgi:FKBP-type peptidyl-prolyl cis-trans isomerase (trigger factor)
MKHYINVNTKELPQSEVEITGEIEADFLSAKFDQALGNIAKSLDIAGFRKGHVPNNIALEKAGEMNILEEAAQLALEEEYPKIIEEKKLPVIGHPKINLTKLARGNVLGFKIVVAIVPKFSLPNYLDIAKKIGNKKEEVMVTIPEIENVILEVRKHHAHMELHKKGEFTDHNHTPVEEKDLPELNDELVKQFGDFKNIADLKEKIKENISKEKEIQIKEKKRLSILEEIISKTEIDVPEVLIDSELEKMLAQFTDDVSKTGLTFDDYLKSIKKEKEDLKKEWRDTAIKKAKVQLIVTEIADKEKIMPKSEEIQKETEKLLIMYQGADPLRARIYVAMMLTNEKVFDFLENQK